MPHRDLPARPHLDHLKNEAKILRRAFLHGEAEAGRRVSAAIGPRTELKLTEAQRVIAREYGFPSWARLRARVQALSGLDTAIDAFLAALHAGDAGRMSDVLRTQPGMATESLHVAAALGRAAEVGTMLAADPSGVRARAGEPPAEPLLWLCYSPLHGESRERDDGLFAAARALLDAGADPNTRDAGSGVPALYAVTGRRNVPRIARLLLEAGANPTDGESVFHAAERFHEEALELLLRFGVQLNAAGDWGNTPLYFLLRYWDVAREDRVRRGIFWLLDHGADPNVRCGEARETALHVAVRRGQASDMVALLLEHGADVHARRADGRTAWVLAERGGFAELRTLLEGAGAEPVPLGPADALVAACSRGEIERAARLATPDVVAALEPDVLTLLVESARNGRLDIVRACLGAGFSVDTRDEIGATALHHACIAGHATIVRELLEHGADLSIVDEQHHGSPLDWACFGADYMAVPGGEYAECVRALLRAGADARPPEAWPRNAGVRAVLAEAD